MADRPDTPSWRQGFDAVERQLSPLLEALVQSEQFAVAVGLAARVQRAVRGELARNTRRVLHRLNLPAGTDVTRILNELGQLRQVRELSAELEEARAELAAAARRRRPTRSPEARPAGLVTETLDPGELVARVRRDAERNVLRVRNGLKHLAGVGRPQLTQTPKETVWSSEKVELWRYPTDRRTIRTPLLFVHSLVSRSYVFDLVPGNSVVEAMVDRGFDVFLVDWGVPDELEARQHAGDLHRRLPADDRRARSRRSRRQPGRQRVRLLLRRPCCRCCPSPATPTCPCAAWP